MSIVKHNSIAEAKGAFQKSFGEAVYSGKWMAVVWSIDKEGKIVNGAVTYDFPIDALDEVSRQIITACEVRRKEEGVAEIPPLPLAPHLVEHKEAVAQGNDEVKRLLENAVNKVESSSKDFELGEGI